MVSQRQARAQHQGIDQKSARAAIIGAPSSGGYETGSGIKRQGGGIVFGDFQEHFLCLSCQGFRRRFPEENTRKAATARPRHRADAENFGLPGGDLDKNEGLRVSRSRSRGSEGENARPREQIAKRCFIPRLRETLAVKRSEQRGILARLRPADRAHGTKPGSFASGARR